MTEDHSTRDRVYQNERRISTAEFVKELAGDMQKIQRVNAIASHVFRKDFDVRAELRRKQFVEIRDKVETVRHRLENWRMLIDLKPWLAPEIGEVVLDTLKWLPTREDLEEI